MDEKSSMIKVLPLIGLIVLVGGVLAYIARAGEGSSAPLPHDKLGAASALLQRGFAADPFPTETDRLAERRDAAGAFVVSDPEKGSPADVIPTITEYLEDEDPMVRSAGAMSVLRIALSEDAWNSGLREAVRTDVRLVGALTQTVGYDHTLAEGDKEMRADAVRALGGLWFDSPNPMVEELLVDRYWAEYVMRVRGAIVGILCDHQYVSAEVEAVLQDASLSDVEWFSSMAERCHAKLFPE